MFDAWNGEYGYMKINDEISKFFFNQSGNNILSQVWLKNGVSSNKTGALNFCGNPHPDPAYNLYLEKH